MNNIYQIITDKVIKLMEEGKTPWQMPWGNAGGYISHSTGKPYSLLNTMMLIWDGGEEGEYFTYKQVVEQGGKIKKGAKAKMVCFYQMCTEKPKTNDPDEVLNKYPVLKYYKVFHESDLIGVTPKYIKGEESSLSPIEQAEKVCNDYAQREGLKVKRNEPSASAYYSPSRDEVVVPMLSQYTEVSEYYSTLYHELTHSTGIKTRCDRGLGKVCAHGDGDYSREELVAEFGAVMSLSRLGINVERTISNSASYLRGWIKSLKNDPRAIVYATAKAEKAVDYIFGTTKE